MRISDWSSDVCSSDLWCRRPRRSVSRVPSAHIKYDHVYPPGTDAADLLVQLQLPFVVLRQVPRDVETEASLLAAGLRCQDRRDPPLCAVYRSCFLYGTSLSLLLHFGGSLLNY